MGVSVGTAVSVGGGDVSVGGISSTEGDVAAGVDVAGAAPQAESRSESNSNTTGMILASGCTGIDTPGKRYESVMGKMIIH
jgi:hypothetical protein